VYNKGEEENNNKGEENNGVEDKGEDREGLEGLDLKTNHSTFLETWTVIQKPNVGQCWGSFMSHMVEQYGNYADCTLFTTACCLHRRGKRFLFKKIFKDVIELQKDFSLQSCWDNDFKNFYMNSYTSQTPENAGNLYTTSPERPLHVWFKKHFPHKELTPLSSHLSIFALSRQQLMFHSQETYAKIARDLSRSALQEEAHYLERLIPSIWSFPPKKYSWIEKAVLWRPSKIFPSYPSLFVFLCFLVWLLLINLNTLQ
jgi:hypothetical protein